MSYLERHILRYVSEGLEMERTEIVQSIFEMASLIFLLSCESYHES